MFHLTSSCSDRFEPVLSMNASLRCLTTKPVFVTRGKTGKSNLIKYQWWTWRHGTKICHTSQVLHIFENHWNASAFLLGRRWLSPHSTSCFTPKLCCQPLTSCRRRCHLAAAFHLQRKKSDQRRRIRRFLQSPVSNTRTHTHRYNESDLKLSVMCYFSPAAALVSPVDSQVTDLKVVMDLGAFNVLVCDQLCNMADIKIQGTESELNFVFCEFSLPNLM